MQGDTSGGGGYGRVPPANNLIPKGHARSHVLGMLGRNDIIAGFIQFCKSLTPKTAFTICLLFQQRSETMIIQLRPLDYKSEHPGNNKKMMYIPVLGRDIVLNVTRYINNTGFLFQLLDLHFQSFVFLYFSLKEVVCGLRLFL